MPTREERSSRTPEEIRDSYYEQQREGIAALTPVPIPPAYEPPAPGTVVPVLQLGYFVKSRTTEGAWWLVSGNDRCSCPAQTGRCWHIRRVEDHVRHLDAANRRPSVPTNPAWFE